MTENNIYTKVHLFAFHITDLQVFGVPTKHFYFILL